MHLYCVPSLHRRLPLLVFHQYALIVCSQVTVICMHSMPCYDGAHWIFVVLSVLGMAWLVPFTYRMVTLQADVFWLNWKKPYRFHRITHLYVPLNRELANACCDDQPNTSSTPACNLKCMTVHLRFLSQGVRSTIPRTIHKAPTKLN